MTFHLERDVNNVPLFMAFEVKRYEVTEWEIKAFEVARVVCV